MPPNKLPRVSGRETVSALQRLGFVVVRQRGSHVVLKKQISKEEKIGCVVPLHKVIGIGLLHNILRQAEVTTEEFIKHL